MDKRDEELMIVRLHQILAVQETQRAIFLERNKAYGDAIKVGGVIGAVMEIIGCAGRLHTLVVKEGGTNIQAIRDTLLDAANYGSIGMMLLDDGNMLGGFNAPGPKGETHHEQYDTEVS